MIISELIQSFKEGFRAIDIRPAENISEEKALREDLSDKQIDDMVDSSFPASDPPSTY